MLSAKTQLSVAQLGYLVFEVSDLEAWRAFAQVLGLEIVERDGNAFDLRMDGHAARFRVQRGPADDLVCVGWEARNGLELDALVARLRERDVQVTEAAEEQAHARDVERLFELCDPNGLALELHCGPALTTPFVSPSVKSGFIADELGLGHVVLACADMTRSAAFYTELLGFRLSDRIRCDIQGFAVDVLFYHCNPRHHSLALGGPHKKQLHHFMIEVADLDDVGAAFDRLMNAGFSFAKTMGRHPNDRMVSFYGVTPSGFQIELGWGGRIVDDASWLPVEYDRVSDWGHLHPTQLGTKREARRG